MVGSFTSKFPPSLNARVHWAARAKLNKVWRRKVFESVGGSFANDPFKFGSAVLTKYSTAKCDYDNLVAQMKPVIDGLVDYGVLTDDSVEHFKCEYLFKRCKRGNEMIHITVTEVI